MCTFEHRFRSLMVRWRPTLARPKKLIFLIVRDDGTGHGGHAGGILSIRCVFESPWKSLRVGPVHAQALGRMRGQRSALRRARQFSHHAAQNHESPPNGIRKPSGEPHGHSAYAVRRLPTRPTPRGLQEPIYPRKKVNNLGPMAPPSPSKTPITRGPSSRNSGLVGPILPHR